jgi:hypothetical protein
MDAVETEQRLEKAKAKWLRGEETAAFMEVVLMVRDLVRAVDDLKSAE